MTVRHEALAELLTCHHVGLSLAIKLTTDAALAGLVVSEEDVVLMIDVTERFPIAAPLPRLSLGQDHWSLHYGRLQESEVFRRVVAAVNCLCGTTS